MRVSMRKFVGIFALHTVSVSGGDIFTFDGPDSVISVEHCSLNMFTIKFATIAEVFG